MVRGGLNGQKGTGKAERRVIIMLSWITVSFFECGGRHR